MRTRHLILLACVGLAGCHTRESTGEYSYETSSGYHETYYSDSNAPGYSYSNGYAYDDYSDQSATLTAERQVTVPETYHVGPYHSPALAKDRDRAWVDEQNPQGYTIEIADGEKASQVANQLYQAPKKERMAEVQYHHNGNAHYKGLYGSYGSYEDAQKALATLPENIKQQAGIKNWREVQGVVND